MPNSRGRTSSASSRHLRHLREQHAADCEAELVAAIAARTGLSEQTVTLVRWTAKHAWQPPSVEAYLEDRWPFERADLPDPAVRL